MAKKRLIHTLTHEEFSLLYPENSSELFNEYERNVRYLLRNVKFDSIQISRFKKLYDYVFDVEKSRYDRHMFMSTFGMVFYDKMFDRKSYKKV